MFYPPFYINNYTYSKPLDYSLQKDKCDQYWPNINTSRTYGDVTVACLREEFYAEFTHRTFTAEKVHVSVYYMR